MCTYVSLHIFVFHLCKRGCVWVSVYAGPRNYVHLTLRMCFLNVCVCVSVFRCNRASMYRYTCVRAVLGKWWWRVRGGQWVVSQGSREVAGRPVNVG